MPAAPRITGSLVMRMALGACLTASFLVSAHQTIWLWKLGPVATDFRTFMTGVDLVRSGHGSQLYSVDAQQAAQHSRYPETRYEGLLLFIHTAYELLLYFPFAGFSYRTGIIAWAILNFFVAVAIGWLMRPYTESLRTATGISAPFWILSFYPVIYVLGEGQDSLIFTLALLLSFRLLEERREFLSGIALSLVCFKFHLAIMIAFFVFLLPAKWRALAGFLCGGLVVGAISMAIVGRDFATSYVHLLRLQEIVTPWGFVPRFMPNLRGFLHLTLYSRADAGTIFFFTIVISAALGSATAWLILRCSSRDTRLLYIVGILTTLLVSYHLNVQDLAIASVPMLLLLDSGFRLGFRSASGTMLIVGIASIYGYRLLAVCFPWLLYHSAVIAAPLLLLWAISVVFFSRSDTGETQPIGLPVEQHA